MRSAETMRLFLSDLLTKHQMQFTRPGAWLKVQAPGFMPLNIEQIAPSVISVMHSYLQNGDVMRDPDVEFYWSGAVLYPLSFRQDGFPQIFDEVMFIEDGRPAKYHPKRYRDLVDFCEMWARNLRAQGFLDGVVLEKEEGG